MRLFDANGLYTREAADISEAVKSVLLELMRVASKFDVRDLTLLVQNAAADATIDYVLESRPNHMKDPIDRVYDVDVSELK